MKEALSKIIKHNKLLIVGVLRHDTADRYYCLTLKKKGNSLDIISHATYNSIDELMAGADKSSPVIIAVDGKGILNKKIDYKNETDIAWKKNLDYKTIYSLCYKTNDAEFISFCRRQPVDDLISSFTAKGFLILDFYVGPLLAVLLQPTLKRDVLASNDTLLEMEHEVLKNISKQTAAIVQEYTFNNQPLSQYHLPLYGCAIHFYLQQPEVEKSSHDTINQEEIIYKKAFNYFGIATLILFFTALLTSYLCIQYYSSENMALNQQNIYSSQTYRQIQELEKQKEHKLKILNETGQLSKNFLSYYVYELVRSVPAQIQLSSLDVFPVAKEIKENDRVVFTANTVVISGSAPQESSFNTWMTTLKQLKWISKFEIISFKKDKKGIAQFEIKILLSNV